jgi:hypothetical protein
MGKTKTNATTPQGARAARINQQAQLDSTSVSGFCNTGEECYAVGSRGIGKNEAYPVWWLSSRLFVLMTFVIVIHIFKKK